MLTFEDCLDICGLTREELRYIVEHEHISELQAAELAERYVILDEDGNPRLRRAIVTDIETFRQHNQYRAARGLEDFIRDFTLSHPCVNRVYADESVDARPVADE